MKRISFKTMQILCMGCLSLAIAASPPIGETEAFAASDSVSSSYSVDTLSVNGRPITNEPQPTLSSEVTVGFVLGIGAVLGIILLLVASGRSNSAHLARPLNKNNSNSLDLWNTMQATNNLSSNSTNSDCSSSTSNSSTSGDSGSTSWSSGDCGGGSGGSDSGGSSWGGDSGGGSGGGGDCGGGSGGSGS